MYTSHLKDSVTNRFITINKLLTSSWEESAGSRYFFPSQLHADDTKFRITMEEEESSPKKNGLFTGQENR